MPFIRLVDPGYAKYNGIIAGTQFENGESQEPLSMAECERIGAFMRIEDAETGEPISIGQRMAVARNKTATGAARGPLQRIKRDENGNIINPDQPAGEKQVVGGRGHTQAKSAEGNAEDRTVKKGDKVDKADLSYDFTQAQLEQIADEKGINGIRDFAKPYGVNGRAIGDIIKQLMARKVEAEGKSGG